MMRQFDDDVDDREDIDNIDVIKENDIDDGVHDDIDDDIDDRDDIDIRLYVGDDDIHDDTHDDIIGACSNILPREMSGSN